MIRCIMGVTAEIGADFGLGWLGTVGCFCAWAVAVESHAGSIGFEERRSGGGEGTSRNVPGDAGEAVTEAKCCCC